MARPDLVELLAHLDSLVEGPNLRSLQDKDIEEHIHKVLVNLADKLGNQYTVDQIRERLWKKFRREYAYPESNFPLLFLQGSSEIQTLDPKTRNLVEERLAVIRLHMALHTPRSRRSRSALPAPVATPSRDRRNSSTPARPSARSNARNRRTNSIQKDASRNKKTSFKAGHGAKPVSRSRTTQSTAVVPSIEIDETPFHSPSTPCSARDPAAPSPLSGVKPIRWPTPVSHNCGKDDENTIAPRSRGMTNGPCLPAIPTESYADMISELAHYKHRYEEAEQEFTNLKKEMRQMESFYALTKGIPEKMLRKLNHKTQQITSLKKQLDSQIDLEPYLAIGHAHGEAPTTQQLLSDFKNMKEQLASILVVNGTGKPSIGSLYGQSADLDVLLRTVFDVGIRSSSEEMLNASPELTLHELIRALTGAAIHRWVFESEYHSIAMTNTPLLQKYRDHIATLCGHEGLCNLDTAAHQSIIEEKDFKDVTISHMASRHTTRLLNALQPLFDKQSQYKTTRKLRLPLDCILRLAIQVRSLSLVGTEDYESIWPSPGSLFDNNEMETEHSGMATLANLVRLPLSPGLRAYPKEKAMVGYHRFGNGQGTSRTPKYVIKALILI